MGAAIGNLFARGWRSIREAGTRRLALTVLLLIAALLVARFSWTYPTFNGGERSTPVTSEAEQALYDLRAFAFAPVIQQDDRILLVVYDDKTLINARKRSPLDRGLLADALRNLDTMGAKAIGIDILFDQPQDEDDELIETLRSMRTPVSVAYAETAVNVDDIVFEQQQYLEQFLERLEGSRAHPASIMLDNSFDVTRVWPRIYPHLPPVMGRTMLADGGEEAKSMAGYEGAIRYRRAAHQSEQDERPLFTSLQIDLFANRELASLVAPQVEGRYVLIGGDIVDYDRVVTTLSNFTGDTHPPGIQVHAEMIAQMLDGGRLSKASALTLWLCAFAVVAGAALTGLVELRSLKIYPLLALQFAVIVGAPFLLHAQGVDTYGLPAAGWIIGWVIAFAGVTSAARASSAVQRRFAQGALGKYLPREMAQEIIEKPELLQLHGEKKQIFVLFSDLEGFTKMSHAIEPEMVATLLNRYLEMLSQVVLDHGGVIDKFVGDAVVAFWGAPIARADDGERAARAGYAMWQTGEEFRHNVAPGLPPIGKTRVGLHWGEAVVGNFGGENRIQYTALGDSMNTAARLEAANKALDSGVMASREFAERSGLEWWRPMGRVVLRGRERPVDLFEPAPDFPSADSSALEQAMGLVEADRQAAVEMIASLVAKHPEDKALANLLNRTRHLAADCAFALG